MYCNNCGKHNPVDSKFCKHCGSKIIKVTEEKKIEGHAEAENNATGKEISKENEKEKVKAGLSGWLALVGLGLIVGIVLQIFSILEYLPMLSQEYNIPGLQLGIQFEFLFTILLIVYNSYLLVQYFQKKNTFPKHYIYFLVFSTVYVILDYVYISSLTASTQELQQVLNDASTEGAGEITRTLVTSVIWISYMNKSKQVKATFVNN